MSDWPPTVPLPQPWRITEALDRAGLYDPQLSADLGTPVGLVDRWEDGTEIPTIAQLAQLAIMTGDRIEYFTDPRPPKVPPFVFLAGGRKRQRGFRPEQPVAIDEYRWKYDRPRPDAALLPLEDPPT